MEYWTCSDIYYTICEHTHIVSVFICVHDWANNPGGRLVAENVDEDLFLTLLGDKVPADWCICSDEDGWINVGFLFKRAEEG